jgi:predicted extracellular nuclease
MAVMGDLNSYLSSLPIDTLREAGLHNVLDQLPPEEQYTYVYQGVSQVLDHILVSDSLFQLVVEVFVLHTNADYPLSPAGDTSPYHKSDHDPLITIFSLP